MIEIEKRGLLTEEKYNELLRFLESCATSLGTDDKDIVYYIYDDKLLKVVNNISKGSAKVSLKMNKLGDSIATKEIEVSFGQNDYEKMKEILNVISLAPKVIEGTQKRKNFIYKGCEIAMKWSKDYGYHFEIEKMATEEKEVIEMEKDIDAVLSELKIVAMTNDEIKKFQKKIEEKVK
jgi:adenylate cyclase class IV